MYGWSQNLCSTKNAVIDSLTLKTPSEPLFKKLDILKFKETIVLHKNNNN